MLRCAVFPSNSQNILWPYEFNETNQTQEFLALGTIDLNTAKLENFELECSTEKIFQDMQSIQWSQAINQHSEYGKDMF